MKAIKIKWMFPKKGEFPMHGKQVRTVYEHGYVGIDNFADAEWVSGKNVICWHELLEFSKEVDSCIKELTK